MRTGHPLSRERSAAAGLCSPPRPDCTLPHSCAPASASPALAWQEADLWPAAPSAPTNSASFAGHEGGGAASSCLAPHCVMEGGGLLLPLGPFSLPKGGRPFGGSPPSRREDGWGGQPMTGFLKCLLELSNSHEPKAGKSREGGGGAARILVFSPLNGACSTKAEAWQTRWLSPCPSALGSVWVQI